MTITDEQRRRAEANKAAATARRDKRLLDEERAQARAADDDGSPSAVAQPPPLVATAATPPFVPPLSATITAVSDALGVSSAQRLGVADLSKLRAVIDEPDSPKLLYVLRRLEVCSLTPGLSRATGIDAAVARLSGHATAEVRERSARIASAWSAQLEAELRRRELASRPGPKPSGTGAPGCKACQGRHRPHTCK